MIAEWMDAAFAAWTDRRMREHLPFPSNRTAVVLVDVQNAFVAPGHAGRRAIREVAESIDYGSNLERLVRGARDRGALIVHAPFVVPERDPSSLRREIPFVRRLRREGILLGEGDDLDIPATLIEEGDLVLEPRSLLNVFYGTELGNELEARGATHIVVAGSVANAGVDSTGRMGVELDYDVTYVSDCIAAFDPAARRASIEVTFPRMANRVLTSEAVLEAMSSSRAP